MKKYTFLLFLMFATTMVFAQTISIHDGQQTVTNGQIKAWGEANQQNANRNVIVLDFEGLGNSDAVSQFYNGGLSGLGFGPGPNHGVYFGGTTLALIDTDAGGTGNFANEPSPNTIMFFLSGGGAVMNVPAGFTTGFSFYYTSVGTTTVYVYDGLDGTGNLLGSTSFPPNYNLNCTGDPTGAFCHWDAVGVAFAGTAKSISFTGSEDQTGFDDVTFGSITPGPVDVPVSNWALFIGIGLILVFAVIRFRRVF